MLQTKNLVKIYKPKKGVPVTALDNVSITFGESGMVFLLGKSGSGKSTLLNVLGGLDSYEKGEIIIKGVSSKKFRQKHFDSYRNTYVGFIFQEYNVLDEFTVGANIALAIELQNRKATDEEINKILKEVDLEGYGARKPNELSGGQKQRVAIARALVKNPQIIMADEPTGALDSVTGKQILETLKKLSKEKLVIVVSHDREFAENYADRIIELADGKVISDLELDNEYKENENSLKFNGNVIEVPAGYHITEDDRKRINEYIENLENQDAKISVCDRNNIKKFKNTDTSKIKHSDGSPFKLIKSKLPLKSAFKIGASSLKYKKFRLVVTILLCCISFGLFGLSDTFGAYNHVEVCTNSLLDTELDYVSTVKATKMQYEDYTNWMNNGYFSDADLDYFHSKTGIKMQGVYFPNNFEFSFDSQRNPEIKLSESEFEIYNTYFSGFGEINQTVLDEMNFKLLAGNLPDGSKNELAISEYIFEVFKKANYTDGTLIKNADGKEVIDYKQINTYSDMLGKKIKLNNIDYFVTAVIDTNFNLERYLPLTEKKENRTTAEELLDYALSREFTYAAECSFSGIAMVGDAHIDKLISESANISHITKGFIYFSNENYGVDSNYLAKLSDIKDQKIVWLDGEKQTLGEKEIIATTDIINFYGLESELQDDVIRNEEEYYKILLKKAKPLNVIKHLFKNPDVPTEEEGYKIVGFIVTTPESSKISSTVVCSDNLFNEFADGPEHRYSFSVGSMPKEKETVKNMVQFCYREDADTRFEIQNSVTYELDALNEVLKTFSKVFLYIGLGFAIFSSIMFANFIATSISYKKQEIGILKAIGSRSNDVFRIFFAESFIIAIINFVLSSAGVCIATAIINHFLRNEIGILITILTFSLRQIVLLLAISVAVAFISSFIPVKKIASKKPIDAIKDR